MARAGARGTRRRLMLGMIQSGEASALPGPAHAAPPAPTANRFTTSTSAMPSRFPFSFDKFTSTG